MLELPIKVIEDFQRHIQDYIDPDYLEEQIAFMSAREQENGTYDFCVSMSDQYRLMLIEIYKALCVNTDKNRGDNSCDRNAESKPTD